MTPPLPSWVVGPQKYRSGTGNIAKLTNGRVKPADFTRPLQTHVHDWVLSLEVGEHLPSSCLGTYRELLHRSNRRGILLSWARPGQGGRCHVSLREPAWVVSSFESLGYAVDHPATEQARSAADLKWMQHNFLVLRRAPPVKGPS